jgi:hypothetical protein
MIARENIKRYTNYPVAGKKAVPDLKTGDPGHVRQPFIPHLKERRLMNLEKAVGKKEEEG